jgi:integrase
MREPHPTDIHDFQRRLERAIKFLNAHPKVSQHNKTLVMQFLERLKAEGLSLARQMGYVQRLTTIAVILAKDFDKAKQPDIEQLIKTVNTKDWAEWTKDNYRVTVKRFWRWLKKRPKRKDPPETEWITIGKAESKTTLPQDLLTKEEIQKLIETAEHPRDKAYIGVSGESGARPGEVLTLKVRSVAFDEYGAVIVVRGKKGERRIRLVTSAPPPSGMAGHTPGQAESKRPTLGERRHHEPRTAIRLRRSKNAAERPRRTSSCKKESESLQLSACSRHIHG